MAVKRLSTAGVDVTLGEPDDLPQVAECLQLKGFCVIDSSACDQLTRNVLSDVSAFPKSRYTRPPVASDTGDGPKVDIAEGLLGDAGSSRILELKSHAPTKSLRDLDQYFMKLSEQLGSFVAPMGFQVSSRTPGILHEASDAMPSSPPRLTAEQASKWMDIFGGCRLMLLSFLGPDKGTLELGLYGQESKSVFKVPTGPNVMVILRTDMISRQHRVLEGKGLVFSCFLMSNTLMPELPPYAAALSEWIMGRIRDLKDSEIAEGLFLEEIPRSWTRAMSSAFMRGQQVSVRGCGCKLPGPAGWSPECTFLDNMVGPDYVVEIPSYRFDLSRFWYEDPKEELWMEYKTYSRHASFTEGADLFDNKVFAVSAQAMQGFPLNERFCLEVGYSAVFEAGYEKKKLQRLKADVLIGSHMTENQLLDKTEYGMPTPIGSTARDANFLSFTLNLMGQSIVFDTDGSSSLTALWHGHAEQCDEDDMTRKSAFSLVASAFVNIHPAPFANFCCRRLLTTAGRCFPMDTSASGFVRGEAAGALVLRRLYADIDNPGDTTASEYGLGLIRGIETLQYGKGAVLTAPSSSVMQEVMSLATHSGDLYPSDIDVVECHAHGSLAADAVEVMAATKAFRSVGGDFEGDGDDSVLALTDHKCTFGSSYPTAGIVGVMRVLFTTMFGVMAPINMLRQLNGHMEMEGKPVQLLTEPTATPTNATGFSCVNSFGGCGSYCSAVVWAESEGAFKAEREEEAASKQTPLVFWPGGGGKLDEEATPSEGYFIAGTFNDWTDPVKMIEEGKGEYVTVIELGDNRWEQFQIWLDGDEARALHPGDVKAPRNFAVQGPDDRLKSAGNNWLIDGRPLFESPSIELEDEYVEPNFELKEKPNRDRGEPGALYRVRLRVAGKYRAVDWELIDQAEQVVDSTPSSQSVYYIAASWNGWRFEEMLNDSVESNLWFSEVLLKGTGGEFAIIRNKDWNQKFYPARHGGSYHEEILGPDDEGAGFNWTLPGDRGDFFRIEFRRSPGGNDGRNVTWKKKGVRDVDPALLVENNIGYSLLGSWDGFAVARGMVWDGSGYTQRVFLGKTGCESFQILLEGDCNAVYHPSEPDACPAVQHYIYGPSSRTPLCWTIGKDPEDEGAEGKAYEVKLYLSEGCPVALDWWANPNADILPEETEREPLPTETERERE